MSARQSRLIDEDRVRYASRGMCPAITMQPTLSGAAGQPVGIIIAEVVCPEAEENALFAGLAAFIRAELPIEKASADIALDSVLSELGVKGRRLGADAIVSTRFELLRGVQKTGQAVLRMRATGTAVVLPAEQSDQ